MPFCFKVHKMDRVLLPKECFVCGCAPDRDYVVVRRKLWLEPSIIWLIKQNSIKIEAPVCERHYIQLMALKYLFWLLAACTVSFLSHYKHYYFLVLLVISTVFVGWKYYGLRNRFFIFDFSDEYVTYSSNSREYLIKLCNLNDAEIFPRSYIA